MCNALQRQLPSTWTELLESICSTLFRTAYCTKCLRDICLCLNAHKNSLYHLGIKQSVNQSTLSRANENRDWRIFADFGAYLINLVQPLYANSPVPYLEMDNDIFVLDSTTISLSLTLWSWAMGKRSGGTTYTL